MGKIILGTILIAFGLSAILGVSLLKFLFAFILIGVGVRMVMGKEHNYWDLDFRKSTTGENFMDELSIFGSVHKVMKSEDFKGGKIVLVFSTAKIDLSQVKTSQSNIDMEIIVLFGGAHVIVPKGWKINSQGTSVFGGYDVKTEGESGGANVNLKGVSIFGGVKVVN